MTTPEKDNHRNAKGQFTKGHPSGRNPKKRLLLTLDGKNVFQIARNAAPEMLEVLYNIAMNKKEKALVRCTAANSILDRGLGKAVSHTVISSEVAAQEVTEVDITQLSEDKLMALIVRHEQTLLNSDVIDGDFEEYQAVEAVNKT